MIMPNLLQVALLTICTIAYFPAQAHTVQLKTTLNTSAILADQKQLAYVKVSLRGIPIEKKEQRTATNIAIVLDRSGSMTGQKIEQAKEAAITAVNHLNNQDIIAIVAYDTTVEVLVPATKASDKEKIIAAIGKIQPRESTALFAGVSKGAAEVRKFQDKQHVNRVILLSDGLANVGQSSPEELGDLGASLIKEGISVTTLGLGLGYNEDLMTKLASKSDGNHAFVENATDLVRIFNQEFGDVLSVVAQDVTVQIQCAEGIRPVRVLGREADIRGQQVTTTLNQLYGNQEKYVLLEVEIPATAAENRRDIARVTVDYLDMTSHRTEHLADAASLRFSANQRVVEESVDKEVMISVTEQIALEKNKEAIKLRDSGKAKEAEELLRSNASYLDQEAKKYGSERLQKQKESNEQSAGSVASPEWSRERKKMRSDQNAIENQQSW